MEPLNAVKVEFTPGGKKYTYLLPKKLVNNVQIGNYLIVSAGYGDMPFKVVRIVECLYGFKPNSKYQIDYKYVVDKVNDYDYNEYKKAKEKSDRFTDLMNALRKYCDEYDVQMFATTERSYENLRHPTVSTVITLTDDSKYQPSYFWEPQN